MSSKPITQYLILPIKAGTIFYSFRLTTRFFIGLSDDFKVVHY